MNFIELILAITACTVLLTISPPPVSARFVPDKSDGPSQASTSQEEEEQSSKEESLTLEEDKFSVDTPSQIVEEEQSSNPDLVGLVEDVVEDVVAPVMILEGITTPLLQDDDKKTGGGSVYDHLMSFRNNLLGGSSSDNNSGEPSVTVASNTGNVNIDLHYNPVFTVYGHLNSMKDFLLGNSNFSREMFLQEPPEALKKAKEAFEANFDLMLRGVTEGMLPRVERIRREAESERRTFIDIFINFLGALLGRQQCSEIIACRTGKFVGYQVPGAGVIMMIMENLIPGSIRSWFNVVKTAVMDRSDNCDVEYLCTLVDDQ